MSTYYDFYLGKKTKGGKIAMVAPFVYDAENGNYIRKSLLSRSRSFIDWDDFRDFMMPLAIKDMADADKEFFTSDHAWSGTPNICSDAYVCSYAEMANAGAKAGFRQGYVPLSDFSYIIKEGYELSDEYEVEMKSADEIAEMDKVNRAEWGKMAFIVRNSTDYIANLLVRSVAQMVPWDSKDYYFICRIG